MTRLCIHMQGKIPNYKSTNNSKESTCAMILTPISGEKKELFFLGGGVGGHVVAKLQLCITELYLRFD